MKKRISITVTAEPYDNLQRNAKRAGFGAKWFGREIDKLVQGLDKIVTIAAQLRETGYEMTEKERKELIVKTAEETFGMKIEDIKK